MTRKLEYLLLTLLIPAVMGCNGGNEQDKSIASTHPKLEKQLAKDSVTTPVNDANSEELYNRYRITMEEYETEGEYAVKNMYKGTMPALDEKSHESAGTYKSALQEGLREGVNFAGKYTVVSVGCGTTCQYHFIVDRQTGKITERIQSSIGAKFNANSRIFVINPPDSTVNYSNCTNCTPEAYVMENDKLRKLSYETDIQE